MLLAVPFHVCPLMPMFTVALTVRSVKFALSVAVFIVPVWPVASVGLVLPITS